MVRVMDLIVSPYGSMRKGVLRILVMGRLVSIWTPSSHLILMTSRCFGNERLLDPQALQSRGSRESIEDSVSVTESSIDSRDGIWMVIIQTGG